MLFAGTNPALPAIIGITALNGTAIEVSYSMDPSLPDIIETFFELFYSFMSADGITSGAGSLSLLPAQVQGSAQVGGLSSMVEVSVRFVTRIAPRNAEGRQYSSPTIVFDFPTDLPVC